MKIDKNKLSYALNFVLAAVPTKSLSPIYKTIFIQATGDELIFRGKSTELDITFTLPIESDLFVVCADPMIAQVVSYFKDGDIDLSIDKQKIVLKQGSKRHTLSYMDAENYPKSVKVKNYQEFDPKEIVRVFTRLSTSLLLKPIDRLILQSFYINPHDKYVCAGDGTRLSFMEDIVFPGSISNPMGRVIMNLLSKLNSLGTNDKFEAIFGPKNGFKAELENGMSWEIIFKSLDGDYPNPKEVLSKVMSYPTEVDLEIDNLEEFKRILEISALYSSKAYDEGKTSHLVLEVNGKDEISCSMKVIDLVEMQETLPANITSSVDNYSIWIDPGILLQTLNNLTSEKCNLRFSSTKLPFVLLEEGFTYIQSPMAKPSEIREMSKSESTE